MWIQVPGPITLMDVVRKVPLRQQKVIDGKVEVVEASPLSMRDFFIEHVSPTLSGWKEYKQGDKIVAELAKAEEQRAASQDDPWVQIEEADLGLFRQKLEKLPLNGYHGMQFLPFMQAVEDAKKERPKDLKAI